MVSTFRFTFHFGHLIRCIIQRVLCVNIKYLTKCVKNGLYRADLLSSTTSSSLIVTTYVDIGFATTTTMPISTTTSSTLKSSTMSSRISPTPTSIATSSTLTSKSSNVGSIRKIFGNAEKQPSMWTNLQGTCCYADGVTCKDIIVQNNVTLQVVSEIRWKGLVLHDMDL